MEKTDNIKDSFLDKRRLDAVPSHKPASLPASYIIAQELGIKRPLQLGLFSLEPPASKLLKKDRGFKKKSWDHPYNYWRHTRDQDIGIDDLHILTPSYREKQGTDPIYKAAKVNIPNDYNERDVERFRHTPQKVGMPKLLPPQRGKICRLCGKKYRGRKRQYCKACGPLMTKHRQYMRNQKKIMLKGRIGLVPATGFRFVQHMKYQRVRKSGFKHTKDKSIKWILRKGVWKDDRRLPKGILQVLTRDCCSVCGGRLVPFNRHDEIKPYVPGKIGAYHRYCADCKLIPLLDGVKSHPRGLVKDDYVHYSR